MTAVERINKYGKIYIGGCSRDRIITHVAQLCKETGLKPLVLAYNGNKLIWEAAFKLHGCEYEGVVTTSTTCCDSDTILHEYLRVDEEVYTASHKFICSNALFVVDLANYHCCIKKHWKHMAQELLRLIFKYGKKLCIIDGHNEREWVGTVLIQIFHKSMRRIMNVTDYSEFSGIVEQFGASMEFDHNEFGNDTNGFWVPGVRSTLSKAMKNIRINIPESKFTTVSSNVVSQQSTQRIVDYFLEHGRSKIVLVGCADKEFRRTTPHISSAHDNGAIELLMQFKDDPKFNCISIGECGLYSSTYCILSMLGNITVLMCGVPDYYGIRVATTMDPITGNVEMGILRSAKKDRPNIII